MIKHTVLFFLVSALASGQTWKRLEGAGPYINNIRFNSVNPGEVILASDPFPLEKTEQDLPFVPFDGTGYKVSVNNGDSFAEAVFGGNYVVDIMQDPFDKTSWYMSYISVGLGYVAISNDNKKTWNTDASQCKGTYFINQIAPNPDKKGEIYAAALNTSTGAVHSDNSFASCNQNTGPKIHAGDVKYSPLNSDIIFMSGKRNYGVYRSFDAGKTWERNESGLENLRILTVQPSAFYPSIVYCGADSLDAQRKPIGKGIFQSLDSGRTFHRIAAPGMIVHNIDAHPSRPELMVASCGTAGVMISCNDGWHWNAINSGLPENADVRTVSVSGRPVEDNKIEIFAGAWGDGLYRSVMVKGDNCELVSVEDEISTEAAPEVSLRDGILTVSSAAAEFAVEVYDISGRLQFGGRSSSGIYSAGAELNALGVYFVKVTAGHTVFTAKVLN